MSQRCAGRLAEWGYREAKDSRVQCDESLALWAMALGSRYTGRPFYSKTDASLSPSVEEVAYLAKSIQRRILHQLERS